MENTSEMRWNPPPPIIEDARLPPPSAYVTRGFDEETDVIRLQPFVNVQTRIKEELALREPPQPYLGPKEPAAPPQPVVVTNLAGTRIMDLTERQAHRRAEAARAAEERESRRVREALFHQRRATVSGFRRAAVAVAQAAHPTKFPPPDQGLQFDPAVMDGCQYPLADLVGEESLFHMRLIEARSSSRVVIDHHTNSVVAVIGGSPRSKTWEQSVTEATRACTEIGSQVRLSDAEKAADCTPSVTGGYGLVHEREPVAPARGKSAALDALVFASLFANAAIRRCAGYATCLFMVFGHRLYEHFLQGVEAYERLYTAERFMPFGIFTAATFHLGDRPRKVLDNDLPGGWAAFLALGGYDWRKHGHIVLWDFNLVVEFCPGQTILLPRAVVRYSFVPIDPTETQYTLIQFTPAPVFSIRNNFGRSDFSFAMDATENEHRLREEWRQQLSGGHWDMDRFTLLNSVPEEYFSFHFTDIPDKQEAI